MDTALWFDHAAHAERRLALIMAMLRARQDAYFRLASVNHYETVV